MMNDRKLVVIAVVSIFIFLASLPVFRCSLEDSTRVELLVSKDQVITNDHFFVIVSLTPSEPVLGLQIDLSFDPSLIQVVSVSSANPLWIFLPPRINNTAGSLYGAGVAVIGTTIFKPIDCFNISFLTLDTDGVVTLSLHNIIVTNATAIPIENVVSAEQTVIIGDGSDTEDDDTGSSPPTDDLNHTQPFYGDFFFSPTNPRVGEDIIFQVDLFDRNEDVVRFLWDFGDGNTSTDKTPIHRYSEPGLYRISLLLWDCNESTYAVDKHITIQHVQADEAPVSTEETPGYELILFITSLLLISISLKIKKKK